MQTIEWHDGRVIPRIGVGCWAIGGLTRSGGINTAYGDVDDAVSLAGLRAADEMGAKLFDTAAYYGGGHSERLLGQAFADRNDIIIATKFGAPVDPVTREEGPIDLSAAAIRASVDRSRTNLRRDTIDLLLFHLNGHAVADSVAVFDTFETLHAEGKIAAFGWSNDRVEGVRAFVGREGFVAVENNYNVFTPAEELMALVAQEGLVALSRIPLAMGLLSGKYTAGQRVADNDVRAAPLSWLRFFANGEADPEYARRVTAIAELLRTGGRSMAQGALSWILARSVRAVPIPGFRTEQQVRENLSTLSCGPLDPTTMLEIEALLGRQANAGESL